MAKNTNQPHNYLPTRIEDQTASFTITPGATPVYNMVPTQKVDSPSETFTGWVKVDLPSGRTCRITALVDDNGSFKINGVTTEIVEGEHGSRRYTPEKEVYLEPGYYFVECRVQDLKPRNESYSNVKHYQAFIKWTDDNGAEVTQPVTQLFNITETGLRCITIKLTTDILGTYSGARTYPVMQCRRSNDSAVLYNVPKYKMVVTGRNDQGEYVERTFEVLRYMPYLASKTSVLRMKVMDETVTGQIRPTFYHAGYDLQSTSTGENGGLVLNEQHGFLIHDGPDDNEEYFGGAGCIEVCGTGEFMEFKKLLVTLSGSDFNNVVPDDATEDPDEYKVNFLYDVVEELTRAEMLLVVSEMPDIPTLEANDITSALREEYWDYTPEDVLYIED